MIIVKALNLYDLRVKLRELFPSESTHVWIEETSKNIILHVPVHSIDKDIDVVFEDY